MSTTESESPGSRQRAVQGHTVSPYYEAPEVYPPSFCDWKLLVAVVVITEVSVVLAGLGRPGFPSLGWLALASVYAQWLALFCASGICVMSGWINRFSSTGAWLACWLITLLLALIFSRATWLAVSVSHPQLLGASATDFVFESVFAVALVTLVFFRYLVIRARWRLELEAQAEARVQALHARIRPHFLFNSLNTVANLIHTDPDGAEAATLDLADLFRGSMRRADEVIPLEDELRLARQYLDMEQRRLGDRLDIHWRVDELPERATVLPLLLQPLLENAVGHGIQNLPDGGTISVYGRSEGDLIVITLKNPVARGVMVQPGNGMAIRNIRERLALAFGAQASLVTNRDQDQFISVLTLPYVEHPDY
jgi:two-component system sensor histidine kinase AlgZ